MLMRRVAISRERRQTATVSRLEGDRYSGSHAPDSHRSSPSGIPSWISNVRIDPLETLGAGDRAKNQMNDVKNIRRRRSPITAYQKVLLLSLRRGPTP